LETIKGIIKDKWFEMVVGALGMNLLSTAFAVFVDNNPLVLLFSFGTIVVLVMLASIMRKRLAHPLPTIFQGRALAVHRKGVVLTIGLHSDKTGSPCLKVIDRFKPKFCALIGTEMTFKHDVGRRIIQQSGINAESFKEEIIDPTNLDNIKDSTMMLIHWMMGKGLGSRDIVVDITGGTATMSVAAYNAAGELEIDTQYVYSEYDQSRNKAVDGTQKALLNT